MQEKWFEFWKNEAKGKDYSELMQQDEIGADTKFMFSEENSDKATTFQVDKRQAIFRLPFNIIIHFYSKTTLNTS